VPVILTYSRVGLGYGTSNAYSFQRSVAILPLRVRTEMLERSFRIHIDEMTRTLIGCPPTAERQK